MGYPTPMVARLLGTFVLDPNRVEEYLQGLIDEVSSAGPPLVRTSVWPDESLVVDLRELPDRLKTYVHNDDIHHSGETILQHIQWVVEDVPKLLNDPPDMGDRPEADPAVLNFAALLHDLGKAYTYKLIDGKHTFRKHGKVSVEIARAFLGSIDDTAFYEYVLDVVRHHDEFMRLIDARNFSGGKTKYLHKFMRTTMYKEHLEDLIVFSLADGNRSSRIESTRTQMLGVLRDAAAVEEKRRMEAEKQHRRLHPPPELLETVEGLLRQERPDLVGILPDLKAVKKALNRTKSYSLLQKISALE